MEIYNGPASYAVGDGIPSRSVLTRGSDALSPIEIGTSVAVGSLRLASKQSRKSL